MTDAPVPPEVDALLGWLRDRHGDDVRLADVVVPTQAGFDSDIAFVRVSGPSLPPEWRRDLVVRIAADVDRLDDRRQEAALHTWLADQGYPVPRILAVLGPDEGVHRPTQVMERANGAALLDDVRTRPWTVRAALRRFARLHVALHELPLDGVPNDADVVDRRLATPRSVAELTGNVALAEGLAVVEAWGDRLRDAPPSLCHGDFHPLNVLGDAGSLSVIDWTDAGLGDRHCDVARTVALFDIAGVVASSAGERWALDTIGPPLGRAYLRRYRSELPVDDARLALWTPLHLLHDWSLVVAPTDRERSLPPDLETRLRRRFEVALAAVR